MSIFSLFVASVLSLYAGHYAAPADCCCGAVCACEVCACDGNCTESCNCVGCACACCETK